MGSRGVRWIWGKWGYKSVKSWGRVSAGGRLACVINGTAKAGLPGHQGTGDTCIQRTICQSRPFPDCLHRDANTKHLTIHIKLLLFFFFFPPLSLSSWNGSQPGLLFILTCLSTENLARLQRIWRFLSALFFGKRCRNSCGETCKKKKQEMMPQEQLKLGFAQSH